jgi:hypothetical protein
MEGIRTMLRLPKRLPSGVTDAVAALEQRFVDITQAELKPAIPAHRATNDPVWEAMAVIQRSGILHRTILFVLFVALQ